MVIYMDYGEVKEMIYRDRAMSMRNPVKAVTNNYCAMFSACRSVLLIKNGMIPKKGDVVKCSVSGIVKPCVITWVGNLTSLFGGRAMLEVGVKEKR